MKKPTAATVYREAARRIERGEVDHNDGACCVALRTNYEYEVPGFSADDFYYAFKPNSASSMWWGRHFGSEDEQRECRILALCFMAAMCDAGDVPPKVIS